MITKGLRRQDLGGSDDLAWDRVRLSVVVPVYESDHSVRELVERLTEVFESVLAETYEVILVDDGSRSPATWSTLTELARSRQSVVAIRLMRNYGKGIAG